MSRVGIDEVAKTCNVTVQTVYKWIKDGIITGIKVGNGKMGHWEFEYDEFQRFIREGNFDGYAGSIKSSIPFTRIHDIESCYPVNLLRAVLGITFDEETIEFDVWDYDIRKFKSLIDKLTDRQKKVIAMRYQFGMTLLEAGDALDLSKERIRQIEHVSLRKLCGAMKMVDCKMVSREDYDTLLNQITKLEAQLVAITEEKAFRTVEEMPLEIVPIDISALDLSVRPYNCLKQAGINTIQDIIQFDNNQSESRSWMHIRNLGKRSLMEIAEKMHHICGYDIRFCSIIHGKPEYTTILEV